MSEETNNEGGLSGLKKTIIGTLGTVVTAGGVWLTTHLGGGETEHKEEVKTEQAAPAAAPAPIVVNVSNNNTNQQKQQSNNSNAAKAAPAPAQQPAPVQAAPAQKESW